MPEIREELSRMRERQGISEANLSNLADDVAALTEAVRDLKETIDRSRGALWVISGASGVVGVVASWLATNLWGKHV
jgi:NADPH-dependent curcumin reductase CurA